MIATIEPPTVRPRPGGVAPARVRAPDQEARIGRLLQILGHIDAALDAEVERLGDRDADGVLGEALRAAHRRCRAPYLRQLAEVRAGRSVGASPPRRRAGGEV